MSNVRKSVSSEPIEFKQLDITRIKKRGYKATKHNPKLPEGEYFTESIFDQIDLSESDSLLLNVGLGRGKSSALIKLMSEIAHEGKYVVISASPFRSLVQKEYNLLTSAEESKKLGYRALKEDYIFRYMDFEDEKKANLVSEESRFNFLQKIVARPVHLISMNLLLANSGDVYFEQAQYKQEYREALLNYCKQQDKKVIFIFDEIHETVHNFKPELIPYFFLWKEVTHKVILATATVTEAVHSVLMQVAHNTNYSIHCMEYERRRYSLERMCKLKLLFAKAPYNKENLDEFATIAEFVDLKSYDNVQVLCFSKNISQAIKADKSLFDGREFNLCTADTNDFNLEESNIGTRFKTGVNIPRADLLVVILPCDYSGSDSQLQLHSGIFSDGLPSILQALARKRDGGDILVFAPKPTVLIESEMYEERFPRLLKDKTIAFQKYDSIRNEHSHLWDYYERKKKGLTLKEHNPEVPEGIDAPPVQFPSFDMFNIRDGQKLLCQRNLSSGKLVYPVLAYKAFQDQFTNCALTHVGINKGLYLDLYLNLDHPHQSVWDFLVHGCKLNTKELSGLSIVEIKKKIESCFKEVRIHGRKYKVRIYSGLWWEDMQLLNKYRDSPEITQALADITLKICTRENKLFWQSREAMLILTFEGKLGLGKGRKQTPLQKKLVASHKRLKHVLKGHDLMPKRNFEKLNDDKIEKELIEMHSLFHLVKKELPFYSSNPFKLGDTLKKKANSDGLKSLYNWHLNTFWEFIGTPSRVQGTNGWVKKRQKVWKYPF